MWSDSDGEGAAAPFSGVHILGKIWRGGHTLRLHTLQGGNEATLPAHGIAHAHLSTATTGLDDAGIVGGLRCEM